MRQFCYLLEIPKLDVVTVAAKKMLDKFIRNKANTPLNSCARKLVEAGISANMLTIAGWLAGIFAAIFIIAHHFWLALILILISRLCDGLDGPVARATSKTDFGGFLDIVLDFFFYGAIPLAFIVADPDSNAIAGTLLLFSFYFNGSTFLTYSIFIEKRGLTAEARGPRSMFFSAGLAEATETVIVFCALCILPHLFSAIAYAFAAVCFWTAFARMLKARQVFSQ